MYILARDEDVFHPALFDTMLSAKPEHYMVIGAAIVKNRETVSHSIRHVWRMGGFMGLARLIGRVMAKRLRLFIKNSPLISVRHVFAAYNIPVEYIITPNNSEFLDNLAQRRPDVIFCAVPNILKERILNLPALGCINRHAGRLPDYRGVEPVFQALRNNEPQVTITYHKMTSEIDAGIVLFEHVEAVRKNDTVYTLYDRLFAASNKGFWQAVDNLEKGMGRPVDLNRGAYYSWPTSEQISEFRHRGRHYI